MYPFRLKPIYDKTIWANNRLTTLRNEPQTGCGTCWEVSAHPYAQNVIINGEYAGQTLLSLIEKDEKALLGEKKLSQMLRLAFLDAADDLSIQVHPYDEYARKYENDEGKTESWYILEADEGATLVAGTTISDTDKIKEAVENKTIEQYVRHIPVKKGDFVCIDSGMLHALGKGILAIEIGQNSNITYRFYDYNRTDAQGNTRPLHIKKSFDVADFSLVCKPVHSPFHEVSKTEEKMLVDREEFSVMLVDTFKEYNVKCDHKRFYCVSNMGKDAKVVWGNEEMDLPYTESIFIPADCADVKIVGDTRLLVSYVK